MHARAPAARVANQMNKKMTCTGFEGSDALVWGGCGAARRGGRQRMACVCVCFRTGAPWERRGGTRMRARPYKLAGRVHCNHMKNKRRGGCVGHLLGLRCRECACVIGRGGAG